MTRIQMLCPRAYTPYTAVIDAMQREARGWVNLFIPVHLDSETASPGCYVSTLVDVAQSPDGAEPGVVTGYPEIRLTIDGTGAYKKWWFASPW